MEGRGKRDQASPCHFEKKQILSKDRLTSKTNPNPISTATLTLPLFITFLFAYIPKNCYNSGYNITIRMSKKQTIIKTLGFLGGAIHQGQLVRGVQRGPALIRSSGVFNLLNRIYGVGVKDYGDVAACEEEYRIPPIEFPIRNVHILGPLLGRLHQQAYQAMIGQQSDLLLTVGGDHSIGTATISAAKRIHSDLRVIWVDAHPDCIDYRQRKPHTPFSDNYHGMPLSHVTGMATFPDFPSWRWLTSHPYLSPKHVVLIAIRDIDDDEYITLAKHGVKCFTMDHIDKLGIGEVMKQSITYLDPQNLHPFHLSIDVDAVDPELVGQTGTRFRYGLNQRESVHIVRHLAHERRMISMDLVEINSSLNETESIRRRFRGEAELEPVSRTVGLSIDLISSLCTKYLTF